MGANVAGHKKTDLYKASVSYIHTVQIEDLTI